jgi:hypothetical protein
MALQHQTQAARASLSITGGTTNMPATNSMPVVNTNTPATVILPDTNTNTPVDTNQ